VAAFLLQQQSWVAVTESYWPAQPEIFTIWLLKKKKLPTLVLENHILHDLIN
jgi:hypothetical protein